MKLNTQNHFKQAKAPCKPQFSGHPIDASRTAYGFLRKSSVHLRLLLCNQHHNGRRWWP